MIKLHLALDGDINSYYKYGPMPGNPDDHWYEFLYEAQSGTGAVINHGDSETVIELSFVDGRRGDGDLTADSIIVDPGAPAAVSSDEKEEGGGGGCTPLFAADGQKIENSGHYDLGPLAAALAGLFITVLRRRRRA